MRIVSATLVMLMLFGVTASAKPMGLYKSAEIMALGKILKVDKEVLNMDQRVEAHHLSQVSYVWTSTLKK